jgi:hypothetical protein
MTPQEIRYYKHRRNPTSMFFYLLELDEMIATSLPPLSELLRLARKPVWPYGLKPINDLLEEINPVQKRPAVSGQFVWKWYFKDSPEWHPESPMHHDYMKRGVFGFDPFERKPGNTSKGAFRRIPFDEELDHFAQYFKDVKMGPPIIRIDAPSNSKEIYVEELRKALFEYRQLKLSWWKRLLNWFKKYYHESKRFQTAHQTD